MRTTIDARPEVVWADVSDLASHVEWMADAVRIDFTSPTTSGIGTTFDCETRIGPFRLTDRMEVTSWEEGRSIGVRHVGLVTGEGTFRLRRKRGGRTRFVWREELRFPWWMGGRIGATIGRPVLTRVWRGNLRRLKALVEDR